MDIYYNIYFYYICVYLGHGTTEYVNGDLHCGAYVEGCKHGLGVQTYFDGAKYDGNWAKNKPHGSVYQPINLSACLLANHNTPSFTNLCFTSAF